MQAKERARLKKVIASHGKAQGAQDAQDVWRPESHAVRRSVEQLLGRQDGVKAAKREFDALVAQSTQLAETLAAKQRLAAAAASRQRSAERDAMARERIAGLQQLAGAEAVDSSTPRFLLQTPFEVSVAGARLSDRGIVTGGSFARFGFAYGKNRIGSARVHFSYVWQNPTEKYVLINAHGYVILDGYIEVGVNGGFWPGDRHARISAQAHMGVHDWGQQGSPLPSAYAATQTAAALDESDGGFAALGAIASKDVFRGFDLYTSLYIVRPGGTLGLVVAAGFPYFTGHDGGGVRADFEQGGHRVVSPGVLIQVLS